MTTIGSYPAQQIQFGRLASPKQVSLVKQYVGKHLKGLAEGKVKPENCFTYKISKIPVWRKIKLFFQMAWDVIRSKKNRQDKIHNRFILFESDRLKSVEGFLVKSQDNESRLFKSKTKRRAIIDTELSKQHILSFYQ